ncbi:polygalacturonate 4-alpha-galacturonosyltransferase [Rhododendron vialii]|uniref:polygalacturonate 4-alpha-galacturonosyltransferase n=1 Tax=Rhododendron vialii TaxID=182163 RepID=UPI00265F047A|nr:polygalacturonate 4-alpha-galacturonosyltransferase [Rhododendron vialii]
MASKRGQRNRGGGGSRSSILVLVFFSLLGTLIFFVGRGLSTSTSIGRNNALTGSNKEDVDWRERFAAQHLKSLFSKEVIDVITASTNDLGPLSLDFFRKNNFSASWKVVGKETAVESNATSVEKNQIAAIIKKEPPEGKQDDSSENHSHFVDTPAKSARRQLRDKRREKRAADLLKQDDEVIVKLENAAIERSKSVDSAVLGKYSIWRKENENENPDTTVRLMRDQIIMARVYISIASMKNKHDLAQELQNRLKESQRALGEATADADLPRSAPEKIKALGQLLPKAREQLFDCKLVTGKLRAMLQTADEQVRSLKKQSTFLSQLAAKTIPNGIHCLSMRLTIDYYLLPFEKRRFPKSENLENPELYHYALFSDNVLAASVVVNSTIRNAKEPEKHVFHLVTDKLNFGAMNMWFLLNPPGKATIHVENVDEFKWLNSSYCPVLRQLESASMKEYYFKADHPTTLSAGSSNLKYRNPKYLSMLNHLRFYLPEVYPKLDKILFLDDDIVVQKDLTGLWSVDLHGKVNGAVETCGESFHRFDKYLNFSNPHIARNFAPNACGWAYGMNIFDLKEWKRKDITGIYHKWQNMNEDRVLWKLGTLPPGLITFYGLMHPLEKSWHVLGLGYNPSIDRLEIERAAVIHYNGNMKPWLELAMTKYRSYWTKYIKFDHPYIRSCKLSE